MKDSARFRSAVVAARLRGVRIIKAYSPKLGRRFQSFSELAFSQWIYLEVDPAIPTFCEQPVHLDLGEGRRLADFWVCWGDSETLLLADDACKRLLSSSGAPHCQFVPYRLLSWRRHGAGLATDGKYGARTVSAEHTLDGCSVSM